MPNRKLTPWLICLASCLVWFTLTNGQLNAQSVDVDPRAKILQVAEQEHNEFLESWKRKKNKLIDEIAKNEERLVELRTAQNSMFVSADSYPEVIKSLHSQRVQLMISVAGLNARRSALAAAQDQQTTKEIDTKLLEPMLKTIRIREEMLAIAKVEFKNADLPRTKVMAAELSLLEAKTELAQARASARSSTALNLIEQSLLDTSLELADQKARLVEAESLITVIKPAQETIFKINKLEKFLSQKQSERVTVETRMQDALKQLESIRAEMEHVKNQDRN